MQQLGVVLHDRRDRGRRGRLVALTAAAREREREGEHEHEHDWHGCAHGNHPIRIGIAGSDPNPTGRG